MNKFTQLIREKTIAEVLKNYPIGNDFLENLRLSNIDKDLSLEKALQNVEEEDISDFEMERNEIVTQFAVFLSKFSGAPTRITPISELTILGGYNKNKVHEEVRITLKSGDIVSIVGPTGSGKSRLLEDIECLAQGDTPTGRVILLENHSVDDETRFELEGKLVAQLSQNMNFVMDLTVKEFLEMHAKSRFKQNSKEIVEHCFMQANTLAGEKFYLSTKITQLSGGQSRALMIADTAFMSESPIVLIDEIENAGINRKEAIELLAKKDKIILISTHDPLLALSANQRIVISNGGITDVIQTSDEEKDSLKVISEIDRIMQSIREDLRVGKKIFVNYKIAK